MEFSADSQAARFCDQIPSYHWQCFWLALCAHPGLPLQGVAASCLPSWRLALAPKAAQPWSSFR